jgi:2-polyprenyl-3-methyl-5-hydroxy-6-metoxy-1,4-benzoquinol methylase
MSDCCDRPGYESTFNDRFARRVARRYERRGLNRTQSRIVEFLVGRGIEGASVLEIGGGVGDLHVELLRRGAASVTNLEISHSYEDEAAKLLEQSGMSGRVTRRFVDIATEPDRVEPADVVVLHRVVCCYPDYERLLTAAGSHARRLLVLSHPTPHLVNRLSIGWDNMFRRIQGSDFRAFVHPPDRMLEVLRAQSLTPHYRRHGVVWDVVGLSRATA